MTTQSQQNRRLKAERRRKYDKRNPGWGRGVQGPWLPPPPPLPFRSHGTRAERATRLLSVALYLNTHSRWDVPKTMSEVASTVPGVRAPGQEATEKRFERALADLKKVGVQSSYIDYTHHITGVAGYMVHVEEPEIIPEGEVVRDPLQRWINILYHVELGYEPTVQQLADYLGVEKGIIYQDINSMSMAASDERNPNSHLLLIVEEGTGVVRKLTGPSLWA